MRPQGLAAPTRRREKRAWSLRAVLVTSLLLFSIVPAATVGWLLYRSNLQSVETLSDKLVDDLVKRVQSSTEEHIARAHTVLNGLAEEVTTDAGVARARQLMQNPGLFEKTAFAMSRMTTSVPHLYLATHSGEYLGVETLPQNLGSLMRVGLRQQGGEGRRYFSADKPGDRSTLLPGEAPNYEPRNRAWYQAAVAHQGASSRPCRCPRRKTSCCSRWRSLCTAPMAARSAYLRSTCTSSVWASCCKP